MKSKPRIAFIGDLTADMYMPQREIHLGGAALNMAVWTKRLGGYPVILSAVGTDAIGKKFPKDHGIQRKRGKTSSIEIVVSKVGERSYGTWNPGVLANYHLRKKDAALIERSDAVVVTVYPPYIHVLNEIHSSPWTLINWGDLREFGQDFGIVRRYAPRVDAMIFGLDKDVDEDRINALRKIAKESGQLVIVTLGQYGSVAWNSGESFVQPVKQVDVTDTTGAGDAFLAAFMVTFTKTKDIQKSLQAGSNIAAKVIQKVGAY